MENRVRRADSTILKEMVDFVNRQGMALDYLEFIPMNEFNSRVRVMDLPPLNIVASTKYSAFKVEDAFYSTDVNGDFISFSNREMRTILYAYEDEIIKAYKDCGGSKYKTVRGEGVVEKW